MKFKYLLLPILFWSGVQVPAIAQGFKHPGLLNAAEDIARIRKGIASHQPDISAGYEIFKNHPQSQYTYQMQGPMPAVDRNPTVGQAVYDGDANAAYQNAMMWAVSGNKLYAQKAIQIVNAWSENLKSIGGRDAVLMAGLGPFKMINAAELLRYTNSGWKAEDIRKTEKHFKEVVYPVIMDFAPFANGNWDAAALKTVMAIGIFCNDRAMFEKAIRYYEKGAGDGSITNYIINEAGQCQESGRDQAHTQLGIAHLGDCCEMAWHQGLDLYGYADNLLLKGFEYTAKYNLGNEVPFVATVDRTGKYVHHKISEEGRGKIRAVYEEIFNHYVKRRGMKAPFTAEAAARIRPEPIGLPGADHIGFGTFLYSRSGKDVLPQLRPLAPAGLVIENLGKSSRLAWIAVEGSKYYNIKRSTSPSGKYQVIAKSVKKSYYLDNSAKPHEVYYYTVTAQNSYGESDMAYPASISTGLPGNWHVEDIGLSTRGIIKPSDSLYAKSAKSGLASFDGNKLTIEGKGTGLDSVADHFTYVYQPITEDGSITIRYVPQLSSQFTQFGLAIREGLGDNAPEIALIVTPGATKQIEAPGWCAKHYFKNDAKDNLKTIATSPVFSTPVVTFSRMTGYLWLRLQKKGNVIISAYSIDGNIWQEIGKTESGTFAPAYIGIAVAAGKPVLSTTILYDHVSIAR